MNLKKKEVVIIFLTLVLSFPSNSKIGFDHDHSLWSKVLSQNILRKGHQTLVNYGELKEDDKELRHYVRELEAVSRDEFKTWTKSDQLAFLINAYNAFTVSLIVKNYPVQSIRDISPFFTVFIRRYSKLFRKKISLYSLENSVIRKNYKEPRVHFALNCASLGCPNLIPKAFTGKNLNQQLEEATKLYFKDKSKNYFDQKKKILYLGKIFDWYEKDFQGLKNYVKPYLKVDYPTLDQSDFKVKFLPFDWGLNNSKKLKVP